MSDLTLQSFLRDKTSSTYTFVDNAGNETTVSGCAAWTPEQAERWVLGKDKVAKALAACVVAGDNFIADSYREAFPEDYNRIQTNKPHPCRK